MKQLACILPLFVFATRHVLADAALPLQVSPGQHFVVDQNGIPFFVQGDSPWFLTESLNASGVDYYLSNRWVQGYNSIILDLAAQRNDDGQAYEGNIYGQLPFTNTIPGPFTNLLSWNENYFTNVDAVIQRAGYYGINVFAYPLYDSYNGSSWYDQMLGNSSNAIWSYGNFIGNRYKNFTNLVWIGAGDYSEPNAPSSCLWNIVAAGITSADTNHLISAQAARPTPASYYSAFVTWDSTYGSQFPYIESLANYESLPVLASFAREPYYENRNITGTPYTALDCRNFAYWAVFSGDMGHFYGDEHQWPFAAGWQAEMWDAGATTITHVLQLMGTRPWWNCVPDSSHTTVTSGYGTYGTGNYVACTREAGGKTVLAYVPSGTLSPTVDLTRISGSSMNAWWYNPQTGMATAIGSYATRGSVSFTPPDSNDWVLVLDDASQDFGPPGAATTTAPTIPVFSASPSLIVTGGTSKLSWVISGNPVPTLWVSPGIGKVSGTSIPVSPSGTTIYTLTASNSLGAVSTQAVVTVNNTIPPPPPSLVQTAANLNNGSSTAIGQAFSSPNAASNLIAVVTSWGTYATTPTVSDTVGNTYVRACSAFSSAGLQGLAIFYAANIKKGPNTVTVNFGGSHGYTRILIAEYQGIDSLNPLDGVASNLGSASTTADSVSSGVVTTTANGDLILGAVENYDAIGTVSAGTSFTLRNDLTYGGMIETAFEDRVQSSAGSTAATFTFSVADTYIAQMVAFRAAASNDTLPPSMPTNLTAVAVSASQINLAWSGSTDNVGVAGYQVFRNGVEVGTTTGDSYSDTGLLASTTYSYTVAAFDAAGNVSAQSASASATTQSGVIAPTISTFRAAPSTITNIGSSSLSWSVTGNPAPSLWLAPGIGPVSGSSMAVSPSATTTYTLTASNSAGSASAQVVVTFVDTLPPSVPTNLTVVGVSTSQINLGWAASSDNVGVAGYQVWRNGVQVATTTTNSYSDTGLSASTSYSYTVAAFDAAGNVSAPSTTASATTQAPVIAPAISSFSAAPSTITNTGSSTLSWSVTGNPAPSLWLAPGIGSVSGSSITVSPSTTTTYTLTASNSAGNASAQVVVTFVDTLPPSVPTNLTAVAISTSQINLTWAASSDNVGVAGYQVWRNGVQVATTTTNSYSDAGLSASTSYTYAVATFDAAGNVSAQSSAVIATTQAASAPPSLVQTGASLNNGSSSTIAQTFSSAVTAGNLIAVVTSWGTSAATPTVSDTAGNTYVRACSAFSPTGLQGLAIFYAANIKKGHNKVTVNFGGSRNYTRILIAEYQGIDPLNPLDGVASNLGSASTTPDSASSGVVTTTASGDLILGAVENYNANGTVSAGTGFALRNDLTYAGMIETAFEDRVLSSAGSTAATFTFSAADTYIAQMVAFRASAAH